LDAGIELRQLEKRLSIASLATTIKMLERRFNSALTSSAGRLFDAVASLIGVRDRVTYEGQAAMELEWLATRATPDGSYPFDVVEATPSAGSDPLFTIDTRPLIREIAHDSIKSVEPERIARRLHSTLTEIIVAGCRRIRRLLDIDIVVLSGGVFANALL